MTEDWLRLTLAETYRRLNFAWNNRYSEPREMDVDAEKKNRFCLQLSIRGQRLSMRHIRMMVDAGKFELLEDIFRKIPKSWKSISPRELLLWVCADGRFKDENVARLVRMLEEKEPGIIAQTSDVFGDTPLWYTLYRYQYGGHVGSSGWREDSSKLAKLLRQLGCDPHAINRLGVSWSEVNSELKGLR